MATVIKPQLSKRSPYYISKHRYYELKHFCLQYREWEKEYNRLESIGIPNRSIDILRHNEINDPTARLALLKAVYTDKLDMVNYCSDMVDRDVGPYLKVAVVEGFTYDQINARLCMPCGRKEFYDLYRRFFYILDKERR